MSCLLQTPAKPPKQPQETQGPVPCPSGTRQGLGGVPCESAESKIGPDLSGAGSGQACVKGCFRVTVLSHWLAGSKIL